MMTTKIFLSPRIPHLHPVENPSRESAAEQRLEAIPSTRLLLGRASVTIDHDGMHYVLRATRAGKLILTK